MVSSSARGIEVHLLEELRPHDHRSSSVPCINPLQEELEALFSIGVFPVVPVASVPGATKVVSGRFIGTCKNLSTQYAQ